MQAMLRLLPWALLLGLVVFVIGTYGQLPDTIPLKLDGSGRIVRSGTKSWFNYGGITMVAVAVQCLLGALSWYLPKKPSLYNFPDKERLLRLPARYQRRAIDLMRSTLDAIAALTLLTMWAVQWLIYRAATGHPDANTLVYIVLLAVATGPVALILTSRISSEVDAAERRWKAEGEPAT